MSKIIQKIVEYFNGKKISEQYPKWEKSLVHLQKRIEYNFHDLTLLRAALTHKSYLRRNFGDHKTPSPFERMEFLGDSILGFIVSKGLFPAISTSRRGNSAN